MNGAEVPAQSCPGVGQPEQINTDEADTSLLHRMIEGESERASQEKKGEIYGEERGKSE